MNINRHNYEEFFLLYVDKELSAADRKAVDVFVQENPDLQMELALLQQTVVKADDIVLHKKDWLYMEEDVSALQENLLLYADDELSTEDKNVVESLLKSNATAESEWNVLQQTKLQPDMEVVFEDKALLYRKEGGRVVGFKWWRVAAAAVLLGFGLWTGVSMFKNNTQKPNDSEASLVKQKNIKQKEQKTNTSVVDQNNIAPVVENTNAENNTATTIQQQDIPAGQNKIIQAEKIYNQNSSNLNQNTTVQNSNTKKPDNNLPKPSLENINNKPSNETTTSNVSSENNNSTRVSGNENAVVKTNSAENKIVVDNDNSKPNSNLTAMQVVNTNTADNGENNSSYLDVDNNKKRTTFAGFIRKAKRVLERTTNVKTGEGIKIAGFEIALK